MIYAMKKGLDLPVTGRPLQEIANGHCGKRIAVTGPDYIGMKPTFKVREGDQVALGEPLFECKKIPGVVYTAPAAGKVVAINRGERRAFQTLEIEMEKKESYHSFRSHRSSSVDDYSPEQLEALLLESGQWTGLRTRPFSKAARPGTHPSSLFISLMDTSPLAADPLVVISHRQKNFETGVLALAKLAPVHLVGRKGADLPKINHSNVKTHFFSGPHPAGNVGTHIHFIDPVSTHKTVWHMDYQDVMGVGHLITSGQLFVERVVSLAGPQIFRPRLLRTRLGAELKTLIKGQVKEGETRIISGPVLNGRCLQGPFNYLGRFHHQVCLIKEEREREFLGWQGPGFDKFSLKNIYAGKFFKEGFDFTSRIFGSPRALVPVGVFEKVMPLDILPTQLLRALLTGDSELACDLGVLELDEEDLALCTFVDPGKQDFGPYLRSMLELIEREG